MFCCVTNIAGKGQRIRILKPGGVGTSGACNCDKPKGSAAGRREACCCLWASWLSPGDGSGWSLMSTEGNENELYNNGWVIKLLHLRTVVFGLFVYFFLNLLCAAIRPFSTACALTSAAVEEAGPGFECCPGSLETRLLLEVTNVWLTLWECRDPVSCSEVLMSEAGVDFGALSDPNPEPRTEDLKKTTLKTHYKYRYVT